MQQMKVSLKVLIIELYIVFFAVLRTFSSGLKTEFLMTGGLGFLFVFLLCFCFF